MSSIECMVARPGKTEAFKCCHISHLVLVDVIDVTVTGLLPMNTLACSNIKSGILFIVDTYLFAVLFITSAIQRKGKILSKAVKTRFYFIFISSNCFWVWIIKFCKDDSNSSLQLNYIWKVYRDSVTKAILVWYLKNILKIVRFICFFPFNCWLNFCRVIPLITLGFLDSELLVVKVSL